LKSTTEIYLSKAQWKQMRTHVSREVPFEACGLLAGKGDEGLTVYEITNEAKSAYRYQMDPKEQLAAFLDMEKNAWELLAIYHSHPGGQATPSEVDLLEANYPEVIQLIWSPTENTWNCRAFRFQNTRAIEIAIILESNE
jgi:proteasome lid subunit RPN8/RPN11